MKILKLTPTIEVQEVSPDLFADATEVYFDRNNALAMFSGVIDDSKSLFVCNIQPVGTLTDITDEQIKTICELFIGHKAKVNPYAGAESLVLLDMNKGFFKPYTLSEITNQPPAVFLSLDSIFKESLSPEGTIFFDLIRLRVKIEDNYFSATVTPVTPDLGEAECPLWVIAGVKNTPEFWKLIQSHCNTGAEDEVQKLLDFFHPNAPFVAWKALYDNSLSEILNETILPRFIPSLALHLAFAYFCPGLIDTVRLFGSL